jgi:hypothetical protein
MRYIIESESIPDYVQPVVGATREVHAFDQAIDTTKSTFRLLAVVFGETADLYEKAGFVLDDAGMLRGTVFAECWVVDVPDMLKFVNDNGRTVVEPSGCTAVPYRLTIR